MKFNLEKIEKWLGFPSVTCPVCRMTSHHPTDVLTGYCVNCHAFTGKEGVKE